MAIPSPTGYLTIHTASKVILTSYSWTRGGNRPSWTRRWPAFQNGLVQRGTVAYGDYVADLCNQNGVDVLSGYYQAEGDNPLVNFRSSLWATARLGNLRLCHMAGLVGFPAKRPIIEAQVKSWWPDLQSPKYARIRISTGQSRPILMFWGNEYVNDYAGFVAMLGAIRTEFRNRGIGEVFIILTDHICGLAGANIAGAVNVLQAADAVYHHAAGLPWETCGGCNKTGVEWTGTQSATQLGNDLGAEATVVSRNHRYYMAGGMPSFDRDLFGSAPQGRVVTTSPAELRTILRTIKNHSTAIWTDSQQLADGEHLYEDVWSVITSLGEWEEGSTVEPSVVRATAYTAPYWEYGNDRMAAIAEVFRDSVRRIRETERPVQPLIESGR
ncbi:MAG: hypothetical protein ABI779_26755 [Acidobacteriota bacterium]